MKFLIKGEFKKWDMMQNFAKTISAISKAAAINKLCSNFGSIYRCRRHLVKIESVEEVK